MACDTCRKRKIRCDGRARCLNCVRAREPACHYEVRPSKTPRIAKNGRLGGNLIELLNSRLQRLENVLLSLSDRLGGADLARELLKLDMENSSDSESDTVETDNYSDVDTHVRERTPGFKQIDVYIGTHSFLSILSKRSLLWIEQQLGPENALLMIPFNSLPMVFLRYAKLAFVKWLDPPFLNAEEKKKMLELPFPEDSGPVCGLLEQYYSTVRPLVAICDFDRMKGLFEVYLAKKPRFRVSELLMMDIALLYMLLVKDEHDTSLSNASVADPDDVFNIDASWEIQDQLLTYAISYFYRLCIVSEGLVTVEALLMFVAYTEHKNLSPQINHMILLPAIRHAQDLGLHRIETYEGLLQEEASHRKRVWWMCHYWDMELCFRSGKSPFINRHDVSVELFAVAPLDCALARLSIELSNFHDFLTFIVQMRSQSYEKLFSATANVDSFRTLLGTLNSLNRKLMDAASLLLEEMRPLFYNDPNFQPIRQISPQNETCLAVKLTFFFHLMVINRLPLMIAFPDEIEKQKLEYRNLSLNAARTVLELIKGVDRESMSESFYSWITFFPFNAFLHLLASCMNFPSMPESFDDVNLLIDTSLAFLGRRGSKKLNSRMDMATLMQILFRLILKVVVVIYEKKTGIQTLKGNAELNAHLDHPRQSFPELYNNTALYKLHFPDIIHVTGKSPFSDDPMSPKNSNNSPSSNRSGSIPTVSPHIHEGISNMYHTVPAMQEGAMNPPFFSDGLHGDAQVCDEIDLLFNSQMNQLPNFFFDSNLQF